MPVRRDADSRPRELDHLGRKIAQHLDIGHAVDDVKSRRQLLKRRSVPGSEPSPIHFLSRNSTCRVAQQNFAQAHTLGTAACAADCLPVRRVTGHHTPVCIRYRQCVELEVAEAIAAALAVQQSVAIQLHPGALDTLAPAS
jgi:hypothetical protein